ncbi:uncharacterized protein LOC126439393 [Schistocerca serialis cubense]|uniref:uncharacterized protein LOC126439393 n=1 Tax=Schistocerca serialis cubense TaxID=2023355 RepID=UPI00214E764E|nr:uncharacterized protein LOC126439393 [Schistocerca serialis cubense]
MGHQQQRTAARAAPTLLPIPLPLPLHAAAMGGAVDVAHGARWPPSVDAPAAVPEFAATTPPDVSEEVLALITAAEVQQRLQKASNTAPGADGVTYSDLRREDPGCHVLARIFSRCWNERKTPVQWKISTTVLIHKKGDVSDVANWRPLALSSTISKLFAAIVADRTSLWAERLNLLSPEQKGFRTFEGCYEHNFIVQTAIDDARRRGGQACFAWLDLANAFGSVPHAHLLGVLSRMGLPEQLHHLIADMYDGCSTRVRTSDGLTEEIEIQAGVKQGCPLSPIVFNLALEPVLRAATSLRNECGIPLSGVSVSALAYADDIVLLARDSEAMQTLLNVVGEAATWAGLTFKPSKCATLHIRRRQTLGSVFALQGGEPAVLGAGDAYLHLGVPTGYKVTQTPTDAIAAIRRDLQHLDASLLAPWQKIDAVRVFLLPRLDFVMRGGAVRKGPLSALDKAVKAAVKSWLFLPQRASTEQLYLALGEGGCGLTPLADAADISTIVHGFRMLHCDDATVRDIAWATLTTAARRRLGRKPSRSDLATYLSGSTEGDLARDGGDIQSLWTRVRNATRRLAPRGVTWRWSELLSELQVEVGGRPAIADDAEHGGIGGVTQPATEGTAPGTTRHLEDGGDGPQHDDDSVGRTANTGVEHVRVGGGAKRLLSRTLRECLRQRLRHILLRKPDQGKVFECTRESTASNHFIAGGKYTRFADWRFIHRARLGVVPLNGCRRFDGRANNNKACRRCGHNNETLPHVINACMVHSAALQYRHNAVLNRLATAVAGRPRRGNTAVPDIRINQAVIGDSSGLRPDLVITDEAAKSVTIVDVTIPFENRRIALDNARQLKKIKYADVARGLAARGYSVTVDALVVGSLGAWDRQNDAVLRHLGIASRYCQLMRRLMVSDTIKWSRDIYVEHITGHCQYVSP